MIRRRRLEVLVAALMASIVGACDGSPASAFGVADSLRIEGRFAEALPHYAAIVDSLSASADTSQLWRAQVGWAETLLRTGRLDSARVVLDRARAIQRDDQRRAARTRYVRSLLLHRQGKLDSALLEAGQALAGGRAHGDDALEVDALSVLATVYSLSGRYRIAAAYAESALAGERRLRRQPPFLVTRLNNLGVEYRHLGRVTDADRVLTEALERASRLSSPRHTMLVSGNFSNLRRSSGLFAQALEFSERGLRAAESLNDLQGRVMGRDDLGSLHLSQGNYATARRYYEESLAANTPVRYAYGRIVVLEGLGRLEIAERRPARAIEHLQLARAAADSGRFGQERVGVRASLALAAVAAGNPGAGLRWANEAIQLSDSVGDLQARMRALEARAAALEGLRRGREAGAAYLEAIDLLESWRGRIALGDLRLGVAEPYWSIYEGAIRALVALGDAEGAFHVAERAKSRMLLELMAQRDASRPTMTRDENLRARVRVLAEERSGARSDSVRATRDRELAAVIDSLTALEREFAHTPLGAARRPNPTSVQALRSTLVAADRVLVEFFWGVRDVYAWSVTRDGVRAARLGTVSTLGPMLDFFRASLETPSATTEWAEPARRVYGAVLAPLALPADADLLIVPDGPLAHVPFEALMPVDGGPLGATRRLSYGPSASVLHALARRTPATTTRTLLVVGNPAVSDPHRSNGEGNGRGPNLDPLPHAEKEAQALYALFRSAGADLLVGRQATSGRWRELAPERYKYLHFAAHAEVSDRRPERTRVLLADGPLDLAAIRAIQINADLVTLSACETALGQSVRGEGVIGLPHAFLSAGAGAVLVTLWRVDDRATAAFMEDFYKEVHAGHAPAAALRTARARRGASGEHPAYWAPFVLVGVS